MLLNHRLLPIVLALLFSHMPISPVSADDSDLQSLVSNWELLDSQLAEKEAAYKAATDENEKADLRGQYTALVDQSEKLVKQIRVKALDNLKNGNVDAATGKVLIGLVMNDAEFNRNNQACRLADKMIAGGVDRQMFEQAAKSDRLSVYSKELMEEMFVRCNQKEKDDLPRVRIETSKGSILVELFENEAPNTVANFISLVNNDFYDGLKFHRVVEGFVAQAGCPNGNGSGGPGYSIPCECNTPDARRHFIGSLSMAHAGPDTGGSQFFLCLSRVAHLDGKHTVFGRVIEGIEVLDKLSRNMTGTAAIEGAETDTIKSMTVVRKREHDYVVKKNGDSNEEVEPKKPPTQPIKWQKESDDEDSGAEASDSSSGKSDAGDK